MAYTVKQLSDLAGVSTRTLHYYDEIGLLRPSSVGDNGYRRYEEEALLRLQQVLFYREMGFSLKEIKDIVARPDFDVLHALEAHKTALRGRVERLNRLIHTVENTILHLKGKAEMSKKSFFEGFTEEKEKQYAQEARKLYGPEEVDASYRRWKSYSRAEKEQIKAEGNAIYADLLDVMDEGFDSPRVQACVARWHQHLRHFYEPSKERLLGLAELYNENPDFRATYEKMRPDMPQFLRRAIQYYVARLPKQ